MASKRKRQKSQSKVHKEFLTGGLSRKDGPHKDKRQDEYDKRTREEILEWWNSLPTTNTLPESETDWTE